MQLTAGWRQAGVESRLSKAHIRAMVTRDLEPPARERRPASAYATPLILALIVGVLAALVAGAGEGLWSLSPDWKLGLMFGTSAFLAASVQVFLQQSFEVARMRRRLLERLDEDQAEARAMLEAIGGVSEDPATYRPPD